LVLIEGLLKLKGYSEAEILAKDIAFKYIINAYCTSELNKEIGEKVRMYEKFNAVEIGKPGSGGEYTVQTGFGWSNGVLLWLMEKYG